VKFLTLVRHGETDFNRQGRLQGRTNTPLNCDGQQQAQRVAEVLKSQTFDGLWSSPLDRALNTAITINEHHQLPIQTMEALIERSFGTFEGLPVAQLRAHEPDDMESLQDFVIPGGESIAQLQQRARELADRIRAEANEHLLIVGHAGLFRPVIGALLNWPMDRWFHLAQHNTCLNSFRFDEDGQVVAYQLNDHQHCL
jgi:broad specificity phosphatase PhoE